MTQFPRFVTAVLLLGAWWVGFAPQRAQADPCGMVPPVLVDSSAIRRSGVQTTYVFHHRGLETIVLRPEFVGKVDQFGMLIPFPTPPAIRKVPDEIFEHVTAAVDPPEVVVDLRRGFGFLGGGVGGGFGGGGFGGGGAPLTITQVRVVREEAVGMYEVAVLEAGSADALKRWMADHAYRFPEGMEPVCEEYVEEKWCFVAVKTKVGVKGASDPQPGQRAIDNSLPEGANFQGAVQAMGFRFPSEKLVVPMRLSVFNSDDLRNVVYVLTDDPTRINNIPEEYVMRQVSGAKLVENLTSPLPVRVIGGKATDIPAFQRQSLPMQRDPRPHSKFAAELFAGDVASSITGRLMSPREHEEKQMVNISERLGLRGAEIDQAIRTTEPAVHQRAVREALRGLKGMTLTVIDGDFPREVLRDQNLTFAQNAMPAELNTPRTYNARLLGPEPKRDGVLYLGALDDANPPTEMIAAKEQAAANPTPAASTPPAWAAMLSVMAAVIGAGVWFLRRKRVQA